MLLNYYHFVAFSNSVFHRVIKYQSWTVYQRRSDFLYFGWTKAEVQRGKKMNVPKDTEPVTGRAGPRTLGALWSALFICHSLPQPIEHSAISPQQLNVLRGW